MDSFEDWVGSTTDLACIRDYGRELLALGASWDTFATRPPGDIANDLIERGEVPALAAHTVVDVAVKAARRREAPLAIFWDIENMPIPATSSGRDVSSRLKSVMKPHGKLVQFRGYASIGLNHIPQQKRSDLQLSGCNLVDCPHVGRKEVADKMIIVDAMHFAMQNPDGATLCFVTVDIDFSYLLAVLQMYPQYTTVVISKGTLQSMLDINCDMKMRWETDILQLRRNLPLAERNGNGGQDGGGGGGGVISQRRDRLHDVGHGNDDDDDDDDDEFDDEFDEYDVGCDTEEEAEEEEEDDDDIDDHSDGVMSGLTGADTSFEPLTENEEWVDEVEFLRNLVRREAGSFSGSVSKSVVETKLRQTNPARFPTRQAVQSFLVLAIEKGIITEVGTGDNVTLQVPVDETTGMFPAISISSQLPLPVSEIPTRVVEVTEHRPYLLIVKWRFAPPGNVTNERVRRPRNYPHAFIRNNVTWCFFLFKRLVHAQQTVSDHPWLRNGLLIDTRNHDMSSDQGLNTMQVPTTPSSNSFEKEDEAIVASATAKVVETMNRLAKNDQISVPVLVLKNQIYFRAEYGCNSPRVAGMWVRWAHQKKLIKRFRSGRFCLPSHANLASMSLGQSNSLNTSAEVDAVYTYLQGKSSGWACRTKIIDLLKERFPETMNHPLHRVRAILDGNEAGRFHYGRNSYGCVVALNRDGVVAGLAEMEGNRST